jgi:hypothetical protein
MSTFTHKGYGRIYVETAEDVQKVHDVIKEIDDFEYSYMPSTLVAPFSEYQAVVYLHKFSDMDIDALVATCWARGIKIWAFDSGFNQYPASGIKPLGDEV